MLYLIWSLFNGFIILYFTYLIVGFIFKGKKIFQNQYKGIALFIFVIGVLQFLTSTKPNKNKNRVLLSENFSIEDVTKIKHLVLEENLSLGINLYFNPKYSLEEKDKIPLEVVSNLSGFVSGFDWDVKNVFVSSKGIDNQKEIYVIGVLTWKIFGIPVYNESKDLIKQLP